MSETNQPVEDGETSESTDADAATTVTEGDGPDRGVESAKRFSYSGSDLNLAARLQTGGTIYVLARASGESSSRPRDLAANDLYAAVEFLEKQGLTLSHLLPSKHQICADLMSVKPVTSFSSGIKLTHHIVTYNYAREAGVIFVVCTGRGTMVDDDLVAPFVRHVVNLMSLYPPCLVAAKRIDRIARVVWALGPLIMELGRSKAYIGDTKSGIRLAGTIESLRIFFEGIIAEEEGKKLPVQSRTGMIQRSESIMVDGRLAYSYGGSIPPGLTRLRLKVGGSLGPPVVYLDSPKYLPEPAHVATGYPEASDRAGRPVDQVENVRWFFQHWLRERQTHQSLAVMLGVRGFSTDWYRGKHGVDATVPTSYKGSGATKVVNSIARHFESYATGRFPVNLGIQGIEDRVIEIQPSDGPWIESADVERIRAVLAERDPSRETIRRMTLVGLQCGYNGTRTMARAYTPESSTTGEERFCYRWIRIDDKTSERVLAPPRASGPSPRPTCRDHLRRVRGGPGHPTDRRRTPSQSTYNRRVRPTRRSR